MRVRRIVVDGAAYRWRAKMIDARWVSVRLWRDGERLPLADVRFPFADPWLNFPGGPIEEPLKPAAVADLIRAVTADGGRHREFEVVDGQVRPS